MANMQQLWRLPAVTVVDMLQRQQVTPLQLVEASEARWKVIYQPRSPQKPSVLIWCCGIGAAAAAAAAAAHTLVSTYCMQETEPLINAMPITCWERAKEKARQMQHPASPPRGYLYGKLQEQQWLWAAEDAKHWTTKFASHCSCCHWLVLLAKLGQG